MRRPFPMTARAAFLATLLLAQEYSSTSSSRIHVNAMAIHNEEASRGIRTAEAVQINKELEKQNTSDGSNHHKRQIATYTLPASDSIVLHLHEIAADVLAPASSSSSSSLPWCTDLSSTTTSTSTTPTSTSSSTSSSIAASNLITSSSAGEAICIALSTSPTSSSSSTTTTTSRTSVRTIIVAPSGAAQSGTRPRSTRTVTAIQTLQRQIVPTPSTTVIQVTSTVFVLSTTTHLNTVYTTITPRPTAAWVTL